MQDADLQLILISQSANCMIMGRAEPAGPLAPALVWTLERMLGKSEKRREETDSQLGVRKEQSVLIGYLHRR